MTSHILTHDYYAITSLITLTLGSFFICNQFYERIFSKFKASLIDVNAIIKFFIVALGFTIASWHSLLDSDYRPQTLLIVLGISAGLAYADIETYILKHFSRKMISRHISIRTATNFSPFNKVVRTHFNTPSYISSIIVGACEEILYRGFMTVLCVTLLSPILCMICLFFVTLFFALSHLNLGNIHILTKFILGLICLFAFIYTKSILTPIIIHITFNTVAVNRIRNPVYE